jgi:hypothetical protein
VRGAPARCSGRTRTIWSRSHSQAAAFAAPRSISASCNQEIIYFRIQDHLRKMGLARKALIALVEELECATVGRSSLTRLSHLGGLSLEAEQVTERESDRFRQLLFSVRAELQLVGERASGPIAASWPPAAQA